MGKRLMNVRIDGRIGGNGNCYMITVNGLEVQSFDSPSGAWRHIEWMYRVASQCFTVGDKKIPALDWLKIMHKGGYMEVPWIEQLAL